VARRELTLASDQDNALAYADGGGPEVDDFFQRAAAHVNAGLAACGFGEDNADVLARNRNWRMPAERWRAILAECLEQPDRSHLVRANVAFDFRHVTGGLDVTPRLVAVLREARAHPDLMRRLARSATDFKPPLGFRGSLVVDAGTDGRGVDLKKGGAIPVANLARFFALSNGITISSTLDRLSALQSGRALDDETAAALTEAFQIVMRIRLEHHAVQIEAGAQPTNVVDPVDLRPLTRAQLREVFRAIAHVQKKLAVYVPLGL
jgi:CBS domain-containing protein